MGRDIRNRRHIGQKRIAIAVCGNGVHPRNAKGFGHCGANIADILGHIDPDPSINQAIIAAIGVTQRKSAFLGPRKACGWHYHKRAKAADINCALHRAFRRRHLNRADLHRFALAVDKIAGGVCRIEGQFKHSGVPGRTDGVGPSNVFVKANRRQGRACQCRPHHINHARYGDVKLIKTRRTCPREMRIANDQAAAIGGRFGPKGPAITAEACGFHVRQGKGGDFIGFHFLGWGRIGDGLRQYQSARAQRILFG